MKLNHALFGSVGFALLVTLILGCAFFGGREAGEVLKSSGDSPAPRAIVEVTDMQGLINAYAQLRAEVSAIKAGRDSFAGVTLQSAAPWSLMPLMAWQMFLSHRRETMRIKEGKP